MKSLSRLITLIAQERGWHLVSSAYCRAEVARNVGKFGDEATAYWTTLRAKLEWVPDALTSKRPLLLTLDLGDFGPLLGTEVYGTLVTTPRDFLQRQGLG